MWVRQIAELTPANNSSVDASTNHTAGYIMAGVGIVLYLVDIGAYLVLVTQRRRFLPFRTKNTNVVGLVLLTSLVFWITSTLANFLPASALGSSDPTATTTLVSASPVCRWVFPWLMVFVGHDIFLLAQIYRLLTLYQILVRKSPATGLKFNIPIMVLAVPSIVLAMGSSFGYPGLLNAGLGTSIGNHDLSVTGSLVIEQWSCTPAAAYHYLLAANWILLNSVLIVLAVLNRHNKVSFNEDQETFYSTVATTIMTVVVLVLLCMNKVWSDYPSSASSSHSSAWFRLAYQLVTIASTNVFFWALTLLPLYGFFFNREKYLQEFHDRLETDGFGSSIRDDQRSVMASRYRSSSINLNLDPEKASGVPSSPRSPSLSRIPPPPPY